jgi:hypothetical protein
MTGVMSRRSRGGGACKKAQGGEASFLFRLNRKRAHASAKRVGGAGVNTVNKDDSYDDKDNNVASDGRQKKGQGPNDPAN